MLRYDKYNPKRGNPPGSSLYHILLIPSFLRQNVITNFTVTIQKKIPGVTLQCRIIISDELISVV